MPALLKAGQENEKPLLNNPEKALVGLCRTARLCYYGAMSQSHTGRPEELHARVRGFVQGVGFRYFVQREAVRLGLRGYTRNMSSGDVEVVAQGTRVVLEQLLSRLRQGPSAADVEDVQATWNEPTEHFSGFTIRY